LLDVVVPSSHLGLSDSIRYATRNEIMTRQLVIVPIKTEPPHILFIYPVQGLIRPSLVRRDTR
jgi:hypothetical protein